MTVVLEYNVMTALLEYLDLFCKFKWLKSGPANAGPAGLAGPWAPALLELQCTKPYVLLCISLLVQHVQCLHVLDNC